LPTDVLTKVLDRLTRDGDDGAKQFEQIADDWYTLGPEYKKQKDFLIEQGKHRTQQTKRAKAGAIKRKIGRHEKQKNNKDQ
jgi:hypothetical protein